MSLEIDVLTEKIRRLDLPISTCAALVSGGTNLSAELSGARPLPSTRFTELNRKLSVLIEIADRIKPLQLSFRDLHLVREWIRLFEQGELKIFTNDASQPVETLEVIADKQPEFIVAFGKHFFAGTNQSGRDLGHTDSEEAAPLSQTEAVEVRNRLRRLGFKDAEVLERTASPMIQSEQ